MDPEKGVIDVFYFDQFFKKGIKPWVISFLNSKEGNFELAKGIEWHARYFVPANLLLTRLHRIAGPEPEMLYKADKNEWEQTVNVYINYIQAGQKPPPLIAIDFIDNGLAVADGNKRYEALRRVGIEKYMTVLCLSKDPRIYNIT